MITRLYPTTEYTYRYSILTAYRGSVAHGMFVPSTEPTSIDDIDLMCVDILPIDYYFGFSDYEMNQGTKETWIGEWDIVAYEFKKFISLLQKGNPNVIGMLWLEKEDYLHITHAGYTLIENRELFNSKQIYQSFIHYAQQQLYKMEHQTFDGYMGEKRKQLVEKFGYDTKNAAHCIRLLRMGNEWLRERKFYVRRADAKELLEIKNGQWTIARIKEHANELLQEAGPLIDKCTLPAKPDEKRVNDLCVDILKGEFF